MGAEVVRIREKGKGAAVRKGLERAKGYDYVFMIDGDGSYDPQDFLKALERLKGRDGFTPRS